MICAALSILVLLGSALWSPLVILDCAVVSVVVSFLAVLWLRVIITALVMLWSEILSCCTVVRVILSVLVVQFVSFKISTMVSATMSMMSALCTVLEERSASLGPCTTKLMDQVAWGLVLGSLLSTMCRGRGEGQWMPANSHQLAIGFS